MVFDSLQDNKLSRRRALVGFVGATGLAACTASGQSQNASETLLGADKDNLERFALNLETWWRRLPLLARIDEAAKAGFVQAEMWGLGESDRSPAKLRKVSQDAGVDIVHCTVNVPNLASTSLAETRDAVARSLDQITALGARFGTVVGHNNINGLAKAEMLAKYQDRLSEVAPLFEAAGVIACIEPFNPFEHPGHFLYGAKDAVSICRAIDSPNIKLNWDLFHMQRYEGNVVQHLREGFDQCGLIQIADSPDRRQPGTGEMNYAFILNEALKLGYAGPIGLECFPREGEEDLATKDVGQLSRGLEV